MTLDAARSRRRSRARWARVRWRWCCSESAWYLLASERMTASAPSLLAVPNVSEGRDPAAIEAIAQAFAAAGAARLLDIHSDADHHRTVLTLAGAPGRLADALVAGAGEALRRIDIGVPAREPARASGKSPRAGKPPRGGQHPYVGAVDVVPVVYLDPARRGAACAEALVAAERIAGELGLPVFLYGELAGGRPRAVLRRGGRGATRAQDAPGRSCDRTSALRTRTPRRVPPSSARARPWWRSTSSSPPPRRWRTRADREPDPRGRGGGNRGGARDRGGAGSGQRGRRRLRGQVSMNVERPAEIPLRVVVEAVRRHAVAEVRGARRARSGGRAGGLPRGSPDAGLRPRATRDRERALGLRSGARRARSATSP